jgi:Tol biopolymer transport system component
MTREDHFVRQLERYLDEYQGSTPLPATVREAVLVRLPTTMQLRTAGERTPRHVDPRGLARTLVAMAAVVAIAVLGIGMLSVRVGGQGATAPGSDLGVFEPARGRVVFVRAGRLEAVDPLDPFSSRAIESADLSPAIMPAGWSADGSKLALEVEGSALYVMDQTGSLERVPVEERFDAAFGCCVFTTSAWLSPDGTEGLVFAGGDDAEPGKLYVLDLDDVGSSRAVRVDGFEVTQGVFGQASMPVWSPDGAAAGYVWSKGGDLATPAVGIVDLASGTSRELTSGWGLIRQIAWSPDGSQLLVVAGDDAPEYWSEFSNPLTVRQPAGLYVVDIDDGEAYELHMGHYVAAAWSPDGSQIVAVDYPGSREVVVMDADGTGDRRVLARLAASDLATGVVWHPIPSASG